VAVLYTGINGYLDDIPVNQVTSFMQGLRDYLNNEKPQFGQMINEKKVLTDEIVNTLEQGIQEYKQTFNVSA
jgi:F-type H+-transporting ATPase subunit alpha